MLFHENTGYYFLSHSFMKWSQESLKRLENQVFGVFIPKLKFRNENSKNHVTQAVDVYKHVSNILQTCGTCVTRKCGKYWERVYKCGHNFNNLGNLRNKIAPGNFTPKRGVYFNRKWIAPTKKELLPGHPIKIKSSPRGPGDQGLHDWWTRGPVYYISHCTRCTGHSGGFSPHVSNVFLNN
jgi:hypothetical protein